MLLNKCMVHNITDRKLTISGRRQIYSIKRGLSPVVRQGKFYGRREGARESWNLDMQGLPKHMSLMCILEANYPVAMQ